MKRRGFLTALAALVASPLARKDAEAAPVGNLVRRGRRDHRQYTIDADMPTVTLGGDVASIHGYNVTWHQFNSEPRRP